LVKLDFKDSTGAVLRSAYVTPTLDSSTNSYVWTWDDTSNTRAAGNYTLVATIIDQAGNEVNTTAPVNGTNGGNDSQQILIDNSIPTQTVSFSSMTKDAGLGAVTGTNTSANANWLTSDASAGRLVSGALSSELAAGDVVEVYSNGVKLGNATVSGTNWAFTDTTTHLNDTLSTNGNTGWTYSAKVVNSVGNSGNSTQQQVVSDFTETAPLITAVYDTASSTTAVASNLNAVATTTNALATIKGTGSIGATIFVYDNSANNLLGSGIVDSNGQWSVAANPASSAATNNLAAISVDPQGNISTLSNIITVTAAAGNVFSNGNFTAGDTGFTTDLNSATTGLFTTQSDIYGVLPTSNFANTIFSATATATSNTSPTNNYNFGTWSTKFNSWASVTTLSTMKNPDGTLTGNVLIGSVFGGEKTIWRNTVDVIAGKTYTFSLDYMNANFSTGTGHHQLGTTIDGQYIQFASNAYEAGHFTATYVATSNKTIELSVSGNHTGLSGGDFVLDNMRFVQNTPSTNSLVAGAVLTDLTNNANNTLTYLEGGISALGGNDVIIATNTNLQSRLAAGGYIHGGAGVDTLQLAAGTVLNLESLTANQTVKSIQQIEIITMQGSSSQLTLSANDVLSLGGSHSTTMAAYDFASTSLNPLNGLTPSSTSSLGKVQMVIHGQAGDLLNLSVLANDGVTGSNGLLGNTGLSGSWVYKGVFNMSSLDSPDGVAHTYRVFDHSTTQAQVLVENTVGVIDGLTAVTITSISTDNGISGTDFLTNDSTLIYNGQVPAAFNSATQRVRIQLLDANGNDVTSSTGSSQYATVNGTTWSWDNTGTTRPAGNYTIKTSIVGLTDDTLVGSYGVLGIATHALSIDTSTPTVAITRQRSGATAIGSDWVETITFTFSEAPADFDLTDVNVTKGTLSDLQPVVGTNGKTFTATFSPIRGTQNTATIGLAAFKIHDAAGNANLDTYDNTATAPQVYESNNQISINYVVSTPLVLDLNGDGVKTVGGDHSVQFDLRNTGTAQTINWVDHHDGFLALDLNHDGRITSGAELFGDHTVLPNGSLASDGWTALKALDNNGDGTIDQKDTAFEDLLLWVDGNGDAVTDVGELKTLADFGIKSISLNHNNDAVVQNGNVLQGFSTFATQDGAQHEIVDVFLGTSGPTENTSNFIWEADSNILNLQGMQLHNCDSIDLTSTPKASAVKVNLQQVLDIGKQVAGDHMLVISGKDVDTTQLTDALNWETVTTGQSAQVLNKSFGSGHGFVEGHTYTQLHQAGANLFIDETMHQVHHA
jgi:Bacterial Ig-like domain/Bacterial Ig domain